MPTQVGIPNLIALHLGIPACAGMTDRTGAIPNRSCNRYLLSEINILNHIEKFHAFLHRLLESFAAADEARSAGAFVDDGGGYCFNHITCAFRFSAGVNQSCTSHVTV